MVMLDRHGNMVEPIDRLSAKAQAWDTQAIERSALLMRLWLLVSVSLMVALAAGIILLAG